MTAQQRGLIGSPATGLMVYQTDGTAGFYFYNGTAWTSLSASGTPGPQGSAGPAGPQGPAGQGVPTGGTAGQVLSKVDATDYNTQWTTPSTGGVSSVTNVYNTNSSLTSNRTVTLGGFNLDFGGTGSLGLNDNALRLRAASNGNHFLKYDATTDGPLLSGLTGGKLTYGTGGISTALSWSSSGVSINGGTSAFTLPTGRGTSGQILQSNGAGAVSWITPGAGSVTTQLYATKNVAQTLANANGTNTGDVVTFGNTVAAPTFGTFDGTTFTATTSGTYYIQVHAVVEDGPSPANTISPWFMVEVNNSPFVSPNNFYGPYPLLVGGNSPSGGKGRGQLQAVLRLNAGDTFKIKGLTANSTATGSALKTDGSTHLTVLRLN